MNTNIKSIIPIPKKLSSLITLFATFLFVAFSAEVANAAKSISVSGNLNFGSVAVGTSAQRTMVITNTGNNTLQYDGVTLPAGFTASPTNHTSISAGTSLSITIIFTPTAVQSYSGTATVVSDATSGPNSLPVSGTGTAAAIALSGNLSFGNVAIGATPQQTLVISNSGSGTLIVSNITYSAGFTGNFSGSIASGTSTNVTVTFSPVAVTNYGGTVTVNSTALSGVNTIAASGTGAGALISLSGNLSFGNVAVGATPQQTLTISNSGNTTLTVSGISYPAGFSGSFSGTIAAGTSTNVAVTFAPAAVQSYGGTVTVSSDAFAGVNTIAASGTGLGGIPSFSGDLNFGGVIVGSSTNLALTVTNTGNAPLTISNIDYPAGFSGDFTGTIPPGGTTNITVTFSPTDATNYTGTVTVNSDTPGGTSTFGVLGNGIAQTRIISLSGDLNFADTIVGQSAQLTLSITNSGNSTMTVSSIDYPTGFSGAFSGTLASGARTNVTVTFSPADAISYSGTVTVNSDATSGANTVTASGLGLPQTRIISLSGDLNFADLMVGDSSQLTLTITNSGNNPLTFTNIEVPTGFGVNITSGTLVPGATTNVTVTFSPVAGIAYTGSITVDSDATSGVNSVTASGNGIALSRVISLSADLDFGSIFVGDSSSLTLTVTNSGNSTLTFTNVEVPAGFAVDITNGVVAPGETTNITVTFSPASAIVYSGVITVDSDATSGVNTANVTGTGTLVPTRIISLSGDLDFSDTIVGNNSQLTLTITNSGNATLTFSDVTLPSGFTSDISSGVIAPGATTNVTVTFSPTDVISYSGTVTVTSDATSGVNTVTALGQGIAQTRIISLSGDLNFNSTFVNSSPQLTLTITNDGNSPLTISNITFPSGFSGGISTAVIASGGTTNVTVTFSPTDTITYSGTVLVDSDATGGSNTVNVAGTGIPTSVPTPLILVSGNLDFGDVRMGTSPQRVMVISNSGNADLTIASINFPAGFSGDFSSGVIAAGGTQNVTVTFSPITAQVYGGSVVVSSDAVDGINGVVASGDAYNYVAAKVKFNGLFSPSAAVAFNNSGYFSGKANKKSAFSAKIRLAGKQYPVSGRFSQTGSFNGVISRNGQSNLAFSLQAGFDSGERWKGAISDGSFTAQLVARHAAFSKKAPASDAGTYTMNIVGTGAPMTNGVATITVTPSGIVKITGTLGDGAKVTQVTRLGLQGELPFFGSLYSKKGSILGWLTLDNNVNGTVDWFKPAGIDPNFESGFSVQTTVNGAKQ